MSQVNLRTAEGDLELTFNFYANRQYERKTAETAPQFIREVMMSQVKCHHLLCMLEVLLIKHHPKLKGTRLENVIEKFLDNRGGSYADICAPIIEAITESGMFKVHKGADDDPDDTDEVEENKLDDEPASVLGDVDAKEDEEEPEASEVTPDADDPTT